MSKLDPAVQSSLITAGAMTIIFILTSLFNFVTNWIQRKSDKQDRILYDTYQRRIALYEEILKALASMTSEENLPMNITERELNQKIRLHAHTLESFSFQLSLFGSDKARIILYFLPFKMREVFDDEPDGMEEGPYNAHLRVVFFHCVNNALIDFTSTARTESGAARLDKRLMGVGFFQRIIALIRKIVEAAKNSIGNKRKKTKKRKRYSYNGKG